MTVTIQPGPVSGALAAIPSKSAAHRLLGRLCRNRLTRPLHPPLIEGGVALALPEVDLQGHRIEAEVPADAVLQELHIALGKALDPVDEEEEADRMG